jgi:hypothetical protein
MGTFVVETGALGNLFGGVPAAVKDLNLHVRDDRVPAFPGPNGAGRTTTSHISWAWADLRVGRACPRSELREKSTPCIARRLLDAKVLFRAVDRRYHPNPLSGFRAGPAGSALPGEGLIKGSIDHPGMNSQDMSTII